MTKWSHGQVLARATTDAVRTTPRLQHSDGSGGLTLIAFCAQDFTFRVLYLPEDVQTPASPTDTTGAVELRAYSSDDEGADFPGGAAVTRTIIGAIGRYFVELTPSASGASWVDRHELGE